MTLHICTVQVRLADGFVRWRCSCGHIGREWYRNDFDWLGVDHARRAFRIHAYETDRKEQGEGPNYGTGRVPVRHNGKELPL